MSIYAPSSIKHPTCPFQHAVKKYGFDAFKRTTLHVFDNRDDAKKMEAFLVDSEFLKRPDVYNIVLGGGDPPRHDIPVYRYDLNGNFINCYPSFHLAAISCGGNSGTSIKIAIDKMCDDSMNAQMRENAKNIIEDNGADEAAKYIISKM